MVGPHLLNIMVGTQLLNIKLQLSASMVKLQLSASMAGNPTVFLHGTKSTLNFLFFKIFKFLGTSLLGMTSFTLQLISYLGFIMTIVIIISSAFECKTVPNVSAPELRAE